MPSSCSQCESAILILICPREFSSSNCYIITKVVIIKSQLPKTKLAHQWNMQKAVATSNRDATEHLVHTQAVHAFVEAQTTVAYKDLIEGTAIVASSFHPAQAATQTLAQHSVCENTHDIKSRSKINAQGHYNGIKTAWQQILMGIQKKRLHIKDIAMLPQSTTSGTEYLSQLCAKPHYTGITCKSTTHGKR